MGLRWPWRWGHQRAPPVRGRVAGGALLPAGVSMPSAVSRSAMLRSKVVTSPPCLVRAPPWPEPGTSATRASATAHAPVGVPALPLLGGLSRRLRTGAVGLVHRLGGPGGHPGLRLVAEAAALRTALGVRADALLDHAAPAAGGTGRGLDGLDAHRGAADPTGVRLVGHALSPNLRRCGSWVEQLGSVQTRASAAWPDFWPILRGCSLASIVTGAPQDRHGSGWGVMPSRLGP